MENDELSQKLQETNNSAELAQNQQMTSTNDAPSNFDLDAVQAVEPKSSFDPTVFEGQRVQIGNVEIKEVIDKYPNGEYDENSTQKKRIVEITTKPLLEANVDEATGNTSFGPNAVSFPQEDGSTKPLVVTARFNLTLKEGEWVISKHPKASLWAFMRKMGANTLRELENKFVTITTTPSKNPEDDKRYLSIVTK